MKAKIEICTIVEHPVQHLGKICICFSLFNFLKQIHFRVVKDELSEVSLG